ncbi:glutaminase A [Alsobacter sp. SYSU M60028]|uniref:Glutaminase n=1 Tax=Alsobacter ponti TaxID=2962936 RepID=A0ABT1LA24_9HYPH|nr:glutaminase A [Alsobacter ponti]MCP8937083.1 glutaminase A [Alsobacter ponti]
MRQTTADDTQAYPGGSAAAPLLAGHPVQRILQDIHRRYRDHDEGRLADYIPELTLADPRDFGIAMAITDGFVHEVGDTRKPFTIQSISKPIVYALALRDHGREAVLRKIGVEPSGDPFNSIAFDEQHNRPFNPMVNSGAIAATALVRGEGRKARLARIMAMFEAFVGRPLEIDEAVYRSEAQTGHRNRAIAYLELNAGMVDGPVEEHLDLYFLQCSIRVTARDLAVVGATLANEGVNPLTGARVLAPDLARDVLSVMATCGMYDYAGGWQYDVGMPAKSGVGGGIMAVLPEQLGLGVYSPRLDETGNSWRGIKVCTNLSRELKLHLLDFRGARTSAVRRAYRGSEVRSKRARRERETEALDRSAHRIAVYEIQGDLSFSDAERLTRLILGEAASFDHIVLDSRRISSMSEVAARVLSGLAEELAAQGKAALLAPSPETPRLAGFRLADGVDAALEACEDAILAAAGVLHSFEAEVELADFALLNTLDSDEFDVFRRHLVLEHFGTGDVLARTGEKADRLFLAVAGRCDIRVKVEGSDRHHRLGSLEAGTMFGELALFENGVRTADVVAATPVRCYMLTREAFAALQRREPALCAKILLRVGASLADRLRRANAEIGALAR